MFLLGDYTRKLKLCLDVQIPQYLLKFSGKHYWKYLRCDHVKMIVN